jgi:ATP-dependent Clp protease adaptor protein ClpS
MSDIEQPETAVAEPIVVTKAQPKSWAQPDTETRRLPPYHVVILNDEEHTFEYVIELLVKIFRHSLDTAKHLTWTIHTMGRAIVYTTHKERAELKREQVLAYGPDPRMDESKGPLGCYIEPAPIE